MKTVFGLIVAFVVGAACRWFDIPAPAPPALTGALLVVCVSLGYMSVDHYKKDPPAQTPALAPRRD